MSNTIKMEVEFLMLQAKTKEGKLVTPASMSRRKLEQTRQEQPFYCPICKEQVIMKAGPKLIPHFAHRSDVRCPSQEGGEGSYHEKGKLLLYEWLGKQNGKVTLEKYLPDINQRPDLLLETKEKKIAIEFQCARIPGTVIQKRNQGYKKAGFHPIWIIGAKNHFNRMDRDRLKIDHFLLQFIHQFSSTYPLTLYFFCPDTLQLATFQDIYLTKTTQAIGKIRFDQLPNIAFKDLFRENRLTKEELYHLWKKEKRYFRIGKRPMPYGKMRTWYQWLYLKGTQMEYLPSTVHLPVVSQFAMRTPPWDWQSRLCLEILQPLAIGQEFSLHDCKRILHHHLMSPNSFPLIQSNGNPIQQYLHMLELIGTIKKVSQSCYKKTDTLRFHQTIDDALHEDDQIMYKLLLQSRNKIQA